MPFQNKILDDRFGSPSNSYHCPTCDALFDKGSSYPEDTFCCTHCFNQYHGEKCEGECQDCIDNEV
jgi:hypothetical protein